MRNTHVHANLAEWTGGVVRGARGQRLGRERGSGGWRVSAAAVAVQEREEAAEAQRYHPSSRASVWAVARMLGGAVELRL